ncbi:MAG: heme biosynthesis protein HemY [Hyphomicrobiales bacterium]|nr:heme biosynthesis protein HemY [Hyphomicrobiales bacterium]
MWRILCFLTATLVLAFLCIFVVEQHGLVSLSLGSRVYETSLGAMLLALLVAAVALYVAIRLLLFVFRLPFLTFALSRRRREAKGHAAISKGLVAVASGDLNAAARHAQAAERLAGHEPLALLLKAQAAQLHGNRAAAKEAFARMSEIGDTRGLGLRGLFVEARRRGDHADAHKHAAEAAALDVFLPWAHEANLIAQCQARDWMAALATLERNHRLGATSVDEMRRAKAALLAARALDLRGEQPKEALETAMKALKIDRALTPAAVTAASVLIDEGRPRRAARILEAAWQRNPHPDLAETYLKLSPSTSAAERAKSIAKLTAFKPEHEESLVARGRALFAARQFEEARQALAPLTEGRPTARICLLMAEIEEAENGMTGLAREWLARAAHAPRDPAWVADATSFPQWAPFSPESGRIGVLVWEHPPERLHALLSPTKALQHVDAPPLTPPPAAVPAAPVLPAPGAPEGAVPSPSGKELPARSIPHEGAESLADPSEARALPGHADEIVVGPEDSAPASEAGEAPGVRNDASVSQDAHNNLASANRIEKVAFPLERAPDDPGAEASDAKGLWRRLTE